MALEAVPLERPKGLSVIRRFTQESVDPLETVKWVYHDAVIIGADGKEKFRQDHVEVPEDWSETTVNVVAEKYFRVINGVKETSAKQMFVRIADWVTQQGVLQGLFDPAACALNFHDELLYMLVHGLYAFNSPVWFNVGVQPEPQCSACFIQSVADSMDNIMELQDNEVRLFRGGSGSGTNLSPLRSSYEGLSRGGWASGPVSFMRGFDQWAGVTKSGGTTRRAAKGVRLDVTHPDILELRTGEAGFIRCKADAEKQAQVLYNSGEYSAEWNKPGNVYDRVHFQNANNSVGVPDEFMEAVESNLPWQTKKVKTGEVVHTYRARDLFNEIVTAAHKCGDPGVQFDTTIQDWHTCPESGRINASNPCSEFFFVDDSACNLGALNLLKFQRGAEVDFGIEDFQHATRIAITAQEILVDASSYPSEKIRDHSHNFRPLGLGYCNLGALLTFWGLPYNSREGRITAAAITAIMTGTAYSESARLAAVRGPFAEYEVNRAAMRRVIEKHFDAAKRFPTSLGASWKPMVDEAYEVWLEVLQQGDECGFRNAQVTVLMPTGTTAFLLGADTTGIEPMLGCCVYKKVVGGGLLVLPNGVIEAALQNLGYSPEQIGIILNHLRTSDDNDIHTAPGFNEEMHGDIFAEALGAHAMPSEGHVEMMIAVQPFISGAISKTVNLPASTTPEQIAAIYTRAWKGDLKSIAVYRDTCKISQPIATSYTEAERRRKLRRWGERRKLPSPHPSQTHKFTVGNQEGYFTVGFYKTEYEGQPLKERIGELFIRMSKQGTTLDGILDGFATSVSLALQHGCPFLNLADKFIGSRFEPAGITDHPNPELRIAKSIFDHIFHEIVITYFEEDKADKPKEVKPSLDGPPCGSCGMLTRPAGSCYVCTSCGTTTGCG